MKLVISYLYRNELNLYGDTGNVEILIYRAKQRGIGTEVIYEITPETNLVFMGGGSDSGQKEMYKDLLNSKAIVLKKYIEEGGAALFICGSYQLMGHYYKSADGSMLDGLGIFDMYTEHFGYAKKRCVGNIVCSLKSDFGKLGTLVGFENHGGRTYLQGDSRPLAEVITGFGNNGEDNTEGLIYKNSIGSYLHGPILSKNPYLADHLIAKALKVNILKPLDDSLILACHIALVKKFK